MRLEDLRSGVTGVRIIEFRGLELESLSIHLLDSNLTA